MIVKEQGVCLRFIWERGWPSDKTVCDSMRWWVIDRTLAYFFSSLCQLVMAAAPINAVNFVVIKECAKSSRKISLKSCLLKLSYSARRGWNTLPHPRVFIPGGSKFFPLIKHAHNCGLIPSIPSSADYQAGFSNMAYQSSDSNLLLPDQTVALARPVHRTAPNKARR